MGQKQTCFYEAACLLHYFLRGGILGVFNTFLNRNIVPIQTLVWTSNAYYVTGQSGTLFSKKWFSYCCVCHPQNNVMCSMSFNVDRLYANILRKDKTKRETKKRKENLRAKSDSSSAPTFRLNISIYSHLLLLLSFAPPCLLLITCMHVSRPFYSTHGTVW